MENEAHIYLQLLVGLVDRFGQRYQRDDLRTLAVKFGFEGTEVLDETDPAINRSPMISQELLGIWKDTEEPSVLFFAIETLDPKRYEEKTEQFRSLVNAILKEFKQEAVFWFPAVRKRHENKFENLLLKPSAIRNANEMLFPDKDDVFGRQVFKTLPIILDPLKDNVRTFLIYTSDWERAPMFIPNFDWIPPYADKKQLTTLEDRELRRVAS